MPGRPEYDVVVAGGTLGVFLAAALQVARTLMLKFSSRLTATALWVLLQLSCTQCTQIACDVHIKKHVHAKS